MKEEQDQRKNLVKIDAYSEPATKAANNLFDLLSIHVYICQSTEIRNSSYS